MFVAIFLMTRIFATLSHNSDFEAGKSSHTARMYEIYNICTEKIGFKLEILVHCGVALYFYWSIRHLSHLTSCYLSFFLRIGQILATSHLNASTTRANTRNSFPFNIYRTQVRSFFCLVTQPLSHWVILSNYILLALSTNVHQLGFLFINSVRSSNSHPDLLLT